jgi:hypothetical protein
MEYNPLGMDFVRIIPHSARQTAAEFQQAILAYEQQPDHSGCAVIVFCEDGYNLTGYCIVAFLRQVYRLSLPAALRAYAEAHPPGIFHRPYLEDLHALYGKEDDTPPVVEDSELPAWAGLVSR